MMPVSTIRRPNALTDGTVPTVHQDSPRTTCSRLGTAVLRFRADWWCVLGGVLLSRTLAGAVPSALSGLASGFGMGAGRFPVAVTTETTGWAVRDNPSWLSSSFGTLFDFLCLVAVAFDARCVWLVGGLGVDRIVDARVYSLLTPRVCYRFVVCAWGVLLFVSAVLVPVSSRPLLVFHFWPINPVVCWGPTRAPGCPVETLS